MPLAFLISLAVHVGVLVLAVIGMPYWARAPETPEVVTVALVSAQDVEAIPSPELADAPPVPSLVQPPASLSAAPDAGQSLTQDTSPPPPVDRVAALPAPARPSVLPEGPVFIPPQAPAALPRPEATPPAPEPDAPQAPREASPETVTEAVETEDNPNLAVLRSPRPSPRPQRGRLEDAPDVVETTAEPTPDPIADAVAAALAQAAVSTPPTPAPSAPLGSALSASEQDGLRVAVSACWNFASLSTEAARVTVEIAMSMTPDAKPVASSLRMISHNGPDEATALQAYEVARRAILRCQGEGYPLPAEKYDQWREIEMTFNPDRMRLR